MFINIIMANASKIHVLFKALGDGTRFNIVSALLNEERCACDLPKIVKRAQPTVSLQLRYLVRAGIVSSRREGTKIIYKVTNQKAKQLMGMGSTK